MDERIKSILIYIKNNIHKPLSLNHLANVSCLSMFHFHRLFKQETGLTIKTFVDILKMEKALQELVYTSKSVAEIAIHLGYNDYETFSRRFKKYYQVSPNDFRNILKDLIHNQSYKIHVIDISYLNKNRHHQLFEKLTKNGLNIFSYSMFNSYGVISLMEHKKVHKKNLIKYSNAQPLMLMKN